MIQSRASASGSLNSSFVKHAHVLRFDGPLGSSRISGDQAVRPVFPDSRELTSGCVFRAALYYGAVCALSGYIGLSVVRYLVKKSGKSSLIIFSLAIIIALSAVVIGEPQRIRGPDDRSVTLHVLLVYATGLASNRFTVSSVC